MSEGTSNIVFSSRAAAVKPLAHEDSLAICPAEGKPQNKQASQTRIMKELGILCSHHKRRMSTRQDSIFLA